MPAAVGRRAGPRSIARPAGFLPRHADLGVAFGGSRMIFLSLCFAMGLDRHLGSEGEGLDNTAVALEPSSLVMKPAAIKRRLAITDNAKVRTFLELSRCGLIKALLRPREP